MPAFCQNNTTEAALTGEIRLRPGRCAYDIKERLCDTVVLIRWEVSQLGNYCIYQDNKKVECWLGRRRAKTEIPVQTTKSIQFAIKERDVVIAQTELIVMKITRRLNSRRRRPWNLF